MKLYQKLMRLLDPACERQRAEYRHELARAQAEIEDLHRTVVSRGPDLAKALEERLRKLPLP